MRRALITVGWIALWLAVIDVGINVAFPAPRTNAPASALVRYFDYGRSIEGKLDRMIQPSPADSAPIISAGWLAPEVATATTVALPPGHDLLVGVYGMSFVDYATRTMAKLDGHITLHQVLGPGAPANHSFTAWKRDRSGPQVAVLGILASGVVRLHSLSGTSWTYEHPNPYTYPRYLIGASGDLEQVDPVLDSEAELRAAFLARDDRWRAHVDRMREHDAAFDPFVFHGSVLDRSALVRLVRRAWANRVAHNVEDEVYDARTGFDPESTQIRALKLMLAQFAAGARARGQRPVLALFNDRGYRAHLYEALAETIVQLDLPTVSTHTIAPADDPNNFIPDGHFTDEVNEQVAKALLQVVRGR